MFPYPLCKERGSMELKLSTEYVCELLDYQAQKAVREVMKTFEIVENKDLLKKLVKEKTYDCYRDLRDLIIAGGRGLEITVFKFKGKE